MNKEFVPYEEALALKELGFDEPCFGYYLCKNSAFGVELELTTNWIDLLPYDSSSCKAPLFQQAFRWFREKYDMSHSIDKDWDNGHLLGYEYMISEQEGVTGSKTYPTYEEAELVCLKKLIQIVKEKTA